LEAFWDTVKNWKSGKADKRIIKPKKLKPVRTDNHNERVVYIPYADDQSYALEASLEAVGQKAKVMEKSDQRSLREGQKVTTGRECYPCVLTTGDMIKLIKSDGFGPEKAAFFMGTAQGPCRFGQYLRFQEHLIRKLGYQDIPFLSLDSENSYGGYGLKFSILAWEGIVAIDILRNIQRLIRPDEVNKGETDRVYLKYRDKVRERIKQGKGVLPVIKEAASSFKRIRREDKDKPEVTVIGEIYVRHNPFANEFVINELEKYGLKVELASWTEWFFYTNAIWKDISLSEGKWLESMKNRARNLAQRMIEKRLASPFKGIADGHQEPEIEEVIKLGEKYLHHSLRGEAILTVGKTLHSIKRGRDGVVNVMPFTCMPGNITVGVTTQIEKDYPRFPILNLTYDGSRQANYLNKIRTFVARVESYHKNKLYKGEAN
jgi:predicted nucleotide-binding protein (sugar kinase/HSP70/actin superfamily)